MNRRVFCALLIYLPSSYSINTFLRVPATTVLPQGAADAAAERLRLYHWCKITKLPLQKVGVFLTRFPLGGAASAGRCHWGLKLLSKLGSHPGTEP